MITLTCQNCGESVGVQSILAAAQQPCGRCGQLLMGPLSHGQRRARPAGSIEPSAVSEPAEFGPASKAGIIVGTILGGLIGAASVAALAGAAPNLPVATTGALLGALTGVLLAPVLAIFGLISAIILPFSLEGILGDGVWSRIARAQNERRLRPLIMPFFVYLLLPMGLCAIGGSRSKSINPAMYAAAGLGAVVLGTVIGGIAGARGRSRTVQPDVDTLDSRLDKVFQPIEK